MARPGEFISINPQEVEEFISSLEDAPHAQILAKLQRDLSTQSNSPGRYLRVGETSEVDYPRAYMGIARDLISGTDQSGFPATLNFHYFRAGDVDSRLSWLRIYPGISPELFLARQFGDSSLVIHGKDAPIARPERESDIWVDLRLGQRIFFETQRLQARDGVDLPRYSGWLFREVFPALDRYAEDLSTKREVGTLSPTRTAFL